MHTYRRVTDNEGNAAFVVIFNNSVNPIDAFAFDQDRPSTRFEAENDARALVSYLNGGAKP